jgi:predicted acyltransferase
MYTLLHQMAVPPVLFASRRFASVDALRGLSVAAMLVVNNPGDWSFVYAPLRHAQWHGCTPADLIFPFFLFVAGVSLNISLAPRLGAGAAPSKLGRALLWRALRIITLGLVLHLLAWWALSTGHFRPLGVLQRIGLCVLACGWLVLHATPRLQWTVIIALLLGYWVLMAVGGTFEPWINLASRIDAAVLGEHAHVFDVTTGRAHDPEGLLSTLPAIATTLLGARAGEWLRAGAMRRLLVAGLSGIALGLLWSTAFPLNKNLWTSSYVLWTTGWAALVLALFHWLMDVRGWPAIGNGLGRNAIAVYAGAAAFVYVLIGFDWLGPLYQITTASWMTPFLGPTAASLTWALAFTAAWWLLAWWFDRRGVYLKI